MAETVGQCRSFGMLLISNKNPKIGSRFTSITMLVVKFDCLKEEEKTFLKKLCFANLWGIFFLNKLFCDVMHAKHFDII